MGIHDAAQVDADFSAAGVTHVTARGERHRRRTRRATVRVSRKGRQEYQTANQENFLHFRISHGNQPWSI
jgi:hypothetical protein